MLIHGVEAGNRLKMALNTAIITIHTPASHNHLARGKRWPASDRRTNASSVDKATTLAQPFPLILFRPARS